MRNRLVLDAVLLVAFVVVMNTSLTGIPIHEWLSIGVTVLVIIHLLWAWDLTLKVLSRFFKHLLSISRVNLVLDVVLFVAFVLVMLSGFLVSESVVPLLGMSVPFGPTWRIIHAVSADLAFVILGLHLGLHWRWIVRAVRRTLHREPLPQTAR